MKCTAEELEICESTLDHAKLYIKDHTIKNVLSQFNKFNSSFGSLFTTLCDEKIITIDPYAEEHNNKSLNLPASTPIENNEEDYTISIRLSHFKSLLFHIREANILNIETLTYIKIEKLESIVSFIDWDRIFDPQPIEINTEALNKVLFYYQKDREQKFVIANLKDSANNTYNYSKDFLKELIPIKNYINEKYKLWIRKEVLSKVKLPQELEGPNIKKGHDIISEKIKEMGKPLYISLVGEILKEDFTKYGSSIRDENYEKIQKINPVKPKKIKVEKSVSTKDLLSKSIIELSKISSQLPPIISKESENSQLFREENFNIIEKLIDYIKYTLVSNKRVTIYEIKVSEDKQTATKSKEIEFEKFMLSVQELSNRISGYKDTETEKFKELFDNEEEEIQKKIHKLLSKCRYIYKILSSLDSFFKNKLKSSKGIQIELKVILSAIDKSQTNYYEFTKQKSEQKAKNATYKPDTTQAT